MYKENWLAGENGRAKTNEKVMKEGGGLFIEGGESKSRRWMLSGWI